MRNYFLKRILIFIPTLIAISLLAFIISVSAPGDPVDRLLNISAQEGTISQQNQANEKLRLKLRKKYNLDKPLFYFRITTLAEPDTLYSIPVEEHQKTLRSFCRKYGNWPYIINYYDHLKETLKKLSAIEADSLTKERYSYTKINDIRNESVFDVLSLLETTEDELIEIKMDQLEQLFVDHAFLSPAEEEFNQTKEAYLSMLSHPQKWRSLIPVFHFFGLDNQYHLWIKGIITKGDFGVSYRDQQPIISRIMDHFWWSFSLTFLSIIIAYIISIPVGILAATWQHSLFDKASSYVVFMLYSLPNFFAGTLLLMLFANPDIFNWFPESGVLNPAEFNANWPFFKKLIHWAPYLVLPLITYTYGSLAFISRQMRINMLEVLHRDYIRTARAKGLKKTTIVIKHGFRNALLPIITIFSNVFPLAVGGSIIIETIFSIPGMGLEIYQSVLSYDYPMIVAVFTILGLMTLLGYLVADILYALVDPRISFT